MISEIKKQIEEHKKAVKKFEEESGFEDIKKASEIIINSLKSGGKIMTCGNGGSAADAQHISAELLGKFEKMRQPLASIALTTDTSMLTAWANDDSYKNIFSRQIEGLGKPEDVLIAISTSGNSENVINAVKAANKKGIKTILFLGKDGGKMKGAGDIEICPSTTRTARIQEIHELSYHIICSLIDKEFN